MACDLVCGNEIWFFIMEMLDIPSLRALSETSKHMHTLSIHVLYSTIDLSVHHTIPQVILQDGHFEAQRPYVQKVFSRQNLFMQHMLDRPELALLVRSFTWTMGLQRLCVLPEWAQKEGDAAPIHNPAKINELFQSLRQVRHVDIHGGDYHDDPCPPPQNLFPQATHIRLSGQMHYALAWAVLCGPNKAPLTSLALHNLLERGRFKGGENFQPHFDPRFKVTKRVLPLEEMWPETGPPIQIAPGEMTHLLGPALQSRCSNLGRFTFGVLDLTAEYRHKMLPPGWNLRTPTIHEDLTRFLRAIHPQNVEIIYSRLSPERHQELKSLYWRPQCRILPRPPNQPQQSLFELLFEGWEGLESLRIQGGQRGPDFQRPLEPLPSPLGRPNLENVRVYFEPDVWEDYQGRVCTSRPTS